ncbi:MAG: hypothetical protein HY981_02270 [Candidatus Magasanikbacteria bacterium]|nr:hypothetical protein [Candidatus Magasanikbacteria bacterium]
MREKRIYADRAAYIIQAVSKRRKKMRQMVLDYIKEANVKFAGIIKVSKHWIFTTGIVKQNHLAFQKMVLLALGYGYIRKFRSVFYYVQIVIVKCTQA